MIAMAAPQLPGKSSERINAGLSMSPDLNHLLSIGGASLADAGCLKSTASASECGVVLTDLSLKVVAIDSGAVSILKYLAGTPEDPEPGYCLPARVIETLRLRELDQTHGASVKVHLDKQSYDCRIYFLQPRNGLLREPVISLHFDTPPSRQEAIKSLAARFRLTSREEQILTAISFGFTNKEVAQELDISPNTVKAFLHQIKLKMGVSSRAEMVMKVFNSATEPY